MLNSISVTGHLGADPTMRYLPNGNCITTFPVYNHYKYSEGREDLCIFKVTFFAKQAENANRFLRKGDLCMVTGRFRATTFRGRGGENKTILEIVGNDFRALGGRRSETPEPEDCGDIDAPIQYSDDVDDLPF